MIEQRPDFRFEEPRKPITRRAAVKGPRRRGRPRRCVEAAAPARSATPRRRAPSRSESASRCIAPASAPPTGAGTSAPRPRRPSSSTPSGGIGGRPIEIIAEDDGTDPKRGAEVVEKFATQHKVDVAFGTLFSHVVMGSAPRAGELKLPYYVVSEGYHVASGALNRYTFQPGITDVKSQVSSMAPWIAANLGKKVTMIFPDYAFGHDHRDYFSAAIEAQGGKVADADPDPADGKLVHPLLPANPGRHRGALPRDGRAGGADLRQGARRAFRLEPAADLRLHRFARGRRRCRARASSSWRAPISGRPIRAMPAPSQSEFDKFYREKVGVDANGASARDPNDISTYSHMFGCWETLYVIKQAMEAAATSPRPTPTRRR